MIRGRRRRAGRLFGAKRRLDQLPERKNFDCAKIFDFVFEFDQCNAKTRCFAKFLDVR